MKLWKYKNYDEYVKVQTEGNLNKLKNVWARQDVFDKIARIKPDAKDIIRPTLQHNCSPEKMMMIQISGIKVDEVYALSPFLMQHIRLIIPSGLPSNP